MRRIKITREQLAIWRQSGKFYQVDDAGNILSEVAKEHIDELRESGAQVLDARNTVRNQVRLMNSGNDAIILNFNGTVLASTRLRGAIPRTVGDNAGTPKSPDECECKNYSGTKPGQHHPVCMHREKWEQKVSSKQLGMAHQVGLGASAASLPRYPIVHTKPKTPEAKKQPAYEAPQLPGPVLNLKPKAAAQAPRAEVKPSAPVVEPAEEDTDPAIPAVMSFKDEDFELGDAS
jgi:hypothetical protein